VLLVFKIKGIFGEKKFNPKVCWKR